MLICCLLLIIMAGFAKQSSVNVLQRQTTVSWRSDFLVSHYDEQEGLPHNIVYCSLKSKDGFLWFGTWHGLSRFDGCHFENFITSFVIASDQPPRKVESVVEDGEGNLWIKTLDWKLSVFYKRTERFEDVCDELKPYSRNIQIIKIQTDGHGKVLLLTKDKDLLLASTAPDGSIKIDKLVNADRYVNRLNYQLNSNVTQISNTSLGGSRVSYVGKDFQIFSVKLRKAMPGKSSETALKYWQKYFAEKSAAVLTFYSAGGFVWKVNAGGTALTCRNFKTGFSRDYPLSISKKITNSQFIATAHHGYFFLSEAGEAVYINPRTMESENIARRPEFSDEKQDSRFFSMNMDRDGVLWLTSTDYGIYKITFPQTKFRLISLPLLKDDGVRSIFQLRNGDIWVGTRGRNLYVLDSHGNVKRNYDYTTYGIGSVYYMMQGSGGVLWLSTKGDGLVKAVPDNSKPGGYDFRHFRHNDKVPGSISGNNVYMTYIDSHRHFWVGTLDGGLNLLTEKNGKTEFYHKYHGMRYPGYGLYMEVRNMVEDVHGKLWVGTIDGLMSLNTDFRNIKSLKLETYRMTEVNTMANSDVYAMYRDHSRNIWICAFGGGLCKLTDFDNDINQPVLQPFGVKEGLQNDVIISVVEDNSGRLWLANSDGLSCYAPASGNVWNFDRSDGFPKVRMEEMSSLYNQNGEIWLGCKEGIIAFRPEQLRIVHRHYPVYIVGGEVNNQDIRSFMSEPILKNSIIYTDHIELKYSQSMFTLEYAALNFNNAKRVIYRYRLEGYDRDWHYVGSGRVASYTNVPPGKYTFSVETMDTSAPGYHSGCQMTVTILPPWWATWWAYLLYILVFLLVSYYTFRYVSYQIKLKNDVYVQTKLAEYKRKFNMEQQDKKFIDDMNSIIEDNLSNVDFEIEMIAKKLGMSRSAFFKKVKGITDETPIDFVKNYKLNHAVELLKHSNMNISDIAYQSGFSDVSYFGKCFRKKFGMSPRDFLNNQKEEEIK